MKLVDLLEVDGVGADRFRGDNPENSQNDRVFGGLVAAQSLRAAGATTLAEHLPHSLHGYFLRPGKTGVPIEYRVERVRDGRSFSTRTVEAVQRGEVIFTLTASFHKAEPGREFQPVMPAGLAHPDDLPPGGIAKYLRGDMVSVFVRCELGPDPETPGPHGYRATRRTWLRASDPLPDDALVHACALTFASDMGSVSGSTAAVGAPYWEPANRERLTSTASLDHSVWFHRPVRADEWFYAELEPVSNQGSRGLLRGSMFAGDGRLVASLAQEALMRFDER